jgi:hypothetical protein
MNATKTTGTILAVFGGIIILIGLFANIMGLGVPGFGWKQVVVTLVGALVCIVGLIRIQSA